MDTVAILGGGLSGAIVAWHLARSSAVRIVVVEPRAELGRGLAYGTTDPDHKLNVPEDRMTLDTADLLHFRRWLSSPEAPFLPPGSATLRGEVFAPRGVFGQYVAQTVQPWIASGRITHRRTRALAARREGAGWLVDLEDGGTLSAGRIVLAVAHPAPRVPAALEPLRGDEGLLLDGVDTIAPDERVLIVGSGLTGADVVATLARRGQRGPVWMLSRHGRRSQPHGPRQPETAADYATTPEHTALGLLRRVRRDVARDAQAGLTWHAVFDRLRAQGPQIWAALPHPERARLLRHLRGLWDIHRFRIAPQTEAVLDRQIAAKRVTPLRGRITGARRGPDGIVVEIGAHHLTVDRIVLATGPAHDRALVENPLLAALAAGGAVTADPHGLGIRTTAECRAIAADGRAQDDLLVAGPLARGAVGELMGVPEITAWAERIARALALRGATRAA
ncbi:FAD/NAD(P)-binding protein [Paenirhodobacter sp.]|uniref:FAD/NAD(P)-binding protein n=1 Tax=Paenirhodobacter sp. TaxID=1965326 RepID=UPI003B3C805F